ncbi:glycosyltransferase [Alkalicoccus daliensis]|uniref:Glycosyltransferase involved in cell wall bisynthesis n=1 Tax=Alkalicoccus daliensis TaxID=745820 RepID=A0A1H0GFT5_9BACI|nr:glycosyltransferase [Alkalicoccus daliensis]SDO05795.1 Glycosyltransferase involved in cell wall bisynthesis [Alkalicoccus daliensis]
MKIKILFFMYSLSGGGAERTVVNIINNLNKEKYEAVIVLVKKENNVYLDLLSKHVSVIILNGDRLRGSIFKLRRCIILEKPDLLFSTINGNNIILLLAKLLSFSKIPTIVREANNRTQSGKVTPINKIFTYITYNFISNQVITLSEGVKLDLVNNFKIKENKIKVIYNPVEVDQVYKLSLDTVEDFERKDKEKLMIAVGRLAEQKDYQTLLKAFEIINKEVNVRLLILGIGPLEKSLKDLCVDLNIEDRVVFLGFKSNPYKYMRLADLFILSSKWEGFGHVIVEAMASEVPVISTNCKSGPDEIIEENRYGVLVPVSNIGILASESIELLKNNEMRRKYLIEGGKRAKFFDAKKIVKDYESCFKEILS